MAEVNRLTQGTWARLNNLSNSRLKKGIAIGAPAAVYSLIDRIGSDWVHMPLTMLVGAIIVTAISSLAVWGVSNRSKRLMSEIKLGDTSARLKDREAELAKIAEGGIDIKRMKQLETQNSSLVTQCANLQTRALEAESRVQLISDITEELEVNVGGENTIKQIYLRTGKRGEGGMGILWDVINLSNKKRKEVLKRIKPGLSVEESVRARFIKEAKRLLENTKLAKHENFPKIFGFGFYEDGSPFFTMELIEGKSLADRIFEDKRLSPRVAIEYAIELANALKDLHEAGIIHRDIKPENILVNKKVTFVGEREVKRSVLKIIDFGLAKAAPGANETRLTHTGAAIGTPIYMAPEQVGGDKEMDHRVDIYALGVMFCEMLTGEPIHPIKPGENPWVYLTRLSQNVWSKGDNFQIPDVAKSIGLPELRDEFRNILRKATHPDRNKRYQSAKQFAQDLYELRDIMKERYESTGIGLGPNNSDER